MELPSRSHAGRSCLSLPWRGLTFVKPYDGTQAQKSKVMEEDKMWKYFIQALLGLNHVHEKKIIHRDIKSLNLFLDGDDNVKVGSVVHTWQYVYTALVWLRDDSHSLSPLP